MKIRSKERKEETEKRKEDKRSRLEDIKLSLIKTKR